MAQLTELARAQLKAAQVEAKGDLDKRQQAVEQLVAPLKEQLGRVDAQLLKLDQERRESRGRLEAQLRTLAETGEKLRTETGALVTALRKPNARGQWGQMQLRNVVELAGMVRTATSSSSPRWLGEERCCGRTWWSACPAASTSWSMQRRRFRGCSTRMRRAMRRSASSTCAPTRGCCASTSRRWPTRRTGTSSIDARLRRDVPPRRALCTAPRSRPIRRLLEDAMAQRVLIATPTTLLALLRAVAYGWQQERVAESAQAISELGRELHARIVKLSSLLATLGSRLNSTVRAYNEAVGSYEQRVLPAARRFEDHGAVARAAASCRRSSR